MMFICGEEGCEIVESNPEAKAIADEDRLAFADRCKADHGEYPSIGEQADRWQVAYETALRLIELPETTHLMFDNYLMAWV